MTGKFSYEDFITQLKERFPYATVTETTTEDSEPEDMSDHSIAFRTRNLTFHFKVMNDVRENWFVPQSMGLEQNNLADIYAKAYMDVTISRESDDQ